MEKLFYSIKTFTTRNFLFLSIAFWILFIYSIFFISLDFNGIKLLSSLRSWDSGHYIGIAEKGYSEKYQFAFFPLYPLITKAIAFFTGSYLSAALMISIISSIIGLVIFFRILTNEFKKSHKKTFLSLLFFPTSFYLVIPYTEGLFFLLSMIFFYYLKRSFLIASIACGLGLVTRVAGFALFPVLIYGLYKEKSKDKLLSLCFALSPFITYIFYLFIETKNPFYFLEAQAHWQRNLSFPFIGFWETLLKISSTSFERLDFNDIINLGFGIFGLGLVLRSFRFLRLEYSIFALISILVPLFTGSLISFPRFLVNIFPIFILIGKTRNLLWGIYIVWSIFLLIYFSFRFISGAWVS